MNRPLRVGMIGVRGLASAPPPRFQAAGHMLLGGAEVAAEQLGRRLAGRGHQVTLFTRGGAVSEIVPGLTLIPALYVPGRRTEALSHSLAATIKALFGRFDVLHFQAVGPGSCAVLARLAGVPSVVTIQGIDWNRGKWVGWEQRALRALGVTGIRAADAVTVVAPSLLEPARSLGARRVSFVPNGYVAPGLGDPSALGRWGLLPQRYHLMMTRLVPEKNVEDVLRAYGSATRRWPLVIAGGGSHSDAYVEFLRGLIIRTPGVHFIGPVHGAEKAALIADAGAFINASSIEGMSLALLEALGAGVPVGISRITGNLDIFPSVGNPGFIEESTFAVGDLLSLTRVLGRLEALTAADRERWATLGKTVQETFSWDRIAVELESIYLSLPSH